MDSSPPQLPGYRVEEPLGLGAQSRLWAGREAGPDGRRVAIRLIESLDPDARTARQRRLDALGRLEHPGLARVLAVLERADGRSAVVQELVVGPDLATVRAGRPGLDLAETLGLVRDLTEALGALHEVGVVHGDVSPSNILLTTTEGRPVLVDLIGGAGREAGTDGFRAPEVEAGDAASTAADVYGVGAVARWAVAGTDRPAALEILGDLTATQPRARPTMAQVRSRLAGSQVTPVRLPDPRTLAGASLRERARRQETIRRPVRRPRRRARHRRSRRGQLLACLVMLVGVAVGGATLARWGPAFADPGPPPVVGAVVALTAARDNALMAADAAALAAVSVPGSPAARADTDLLAALAAAEVELTGLRTDVTDAVLVDDAGERAVVRAVLTQAAHERTTAEGAEAIEALPPRCVELTLELADDAWLISEVAACAE